MSNPWAGRFTGSPADAFLAFSSSLAEDAHLIRADVIGSLAHVRALERAKVLTTEEAQALAQGLRDVLADLGAGRAVLDPALEDVHMNVESLLAKKVGAVAGKLHTARSRNDQVALDLRMATRAMLLDLAEALVALERALLDVAARHAADAMPGYTHLQPAQPVTFGHWAHAHAERFARDARRAALAFDATNAASPLGAGALAGTSFPLDPVATAADLGFDGAFANSLDAVSDRDFIAGALYVASLASIHLSGLGEELVLWSSPAYGFLTLAEAWTTGSSIMPQKKNPDAAELLRGRAGRALGALVEVLTTLKALPLAYNRDLQEAKAPLFVLPRVTESVRVAAALVAGLAFDAERAKAALARGHPEATELADWLAQRGVPFREAHHAVGRLVALADTRGKRLGELSLADLQSVDARFTKDASRVLDPQAAARAKESPGGTSPSRVAAAVGAAREQLAVAERELAARRARVAAAEERLLG
ncbi:MAG: argininosuccinate lyase [Thermoplasmatota archaeon]